MYSVATVTVKVSTVLQLHRPPSVCSAAPPPLLLPGDGRAMIDSRAGAAAMTSSRSLCGRIVVHLLCTCVFTLLRCDGRCCSHTSRSRPHLSGVVSPASRRLLNTQAPVSLTACTHTHEQIVVACCGGVVTSRDAAAAAAEGRSLTQRQRRVLIAALTAECRRRKLMTALLSRLALLIALTGRCACCCHSEVPSPLPAGVSTSVDAR